MRREVIAVDMDDVVVETAGQIINHVNQTYGAKMDINHFYSRDPALWGAPDVKTAIARVNSYTETEEFFESSPVQQSIHTLRALKKVHDLFIVTGRPDFIEVATRRWLKEHLPDIFQDVVFTNYFNSQKVRSKGDVCRELGATVLIDDHLDHCLSALQQNVRPLLFGNYPWNQADELPNGIERVLGWSQVEERLLP